MKINISTFKINPSAFKKMLTGVIVSFISLGCSEDDDPARSTYIILNRVNNQANISLYNSKTKTLTEQFYTSEEPISIFKGANRNGDFLYVTTASFSTPPKLIKINAATGEEKKAVDVWSDFYNTYVEFLNDNIIITYFMEFDQLLVTKVYDEELTLLDSIGRQDIYGLYAVAVHDNRLFSSIVNDDGVFIHVMDLNSMESLDSVEITTPVVKFIPYSQNQLIGIKSDQYFKLNTETLEIDNSNTAYIGREIALKSSEDILYFLRQLAQPAIQEYILSKVKISTGESINITDIGESINDPIIFDSKAKVIVTGGGLKIFSEDGEVIDWVEDAPPNTWMIFVQ